MTFAGFVTSWGALAQILAVLIAAMLVNRFAPSKRARIRRTFIILIAYLGAVVVSHALRLSGSEHWALSVTTLAEVLAMISAVNIAGLLLFELAAPAIGVGVATIVSDLTMGSAYLIAIFTVMRESGIDAAGLITTSAIVTGILALSLQTTLGNIIGGVALQLDDSIRPGDWIQLENGKQGKVRQIRWRHTVIETRDWDTLIVPNASLLAANIIILGKRDGQPLQHRMWVYFNVDFRYPPADVIHAVELALRAAPLEGVASDPPPNCICADFAKDHRDSFAYYAVRYWLTDLARDDPTSSLVRSRIYTALKRASIPLAVPAAQLFVEEDSLERRARKEQREHDQQLVAVDRVSFLGPLTPQEREYIAGQLRYTPFARGETMTRQGAVAHWLYILTAGKADVRVAVEGGDKVVATLEAPSFFGEMGCMTGEPRAATVIASTDVVCYRLDREAFVQILADRPQIAADMSALLAKRSVELVAAREDLDAAAQQRRMEVEETRILATLRTFFGLNAAR